LQQVSVQSPGNPQSQSSPASITMFPQTGKLGTKSLQDFKNRTFKIIFLKTSVNFSLNLENSIFE
jgi:hypothetical protein